MRWGLIPATVVLIAAAPVFAQSTEPQFSLPPPVLTIDQDRLVSETIAGSALSDELEARTKALAEENAQIETDLVARELDLTQKRPTLSPDAFRALADAFDEEVQRIRLEQDQKAREIGRAQEQAQQDFLADSAVIISEIVRERGALIVLDRRDVFLSADSIDITDEAIERINATSR